MRVLKLSSARRQSADDDPRRSSSVCLETPTSGVTSTGFGSRSQISNRSPRLRAIATRSRLCFSIESTFCAFCPAGRGAACCDRAATGAADGSLEPARDGVAGPGIASGRTHHGPQLLGQFFGDPGALELLVHDRRTTSRRQRGDVQWVGVRPADRSRRRVQWTNCAQQSFGRGCTCPLRRDRVPCCAHALTGAACSKV